MRVITGTARGRRLQTLEGNDVRPTYDKVKEAVFSIVHFDIEGSNVLDLFSGSGQLGIEAISRGASKCTFVDISQKSVKITNENIKTCGFEDKASVLNTDSIGYLRTCRLVFDLAFLDPPYRKGIIEEALPLLEAHMSQRGIAVCEHEVGLALPDEVGRLKKSRTYKYGKIEVTVYRILCNNEE
ncbi:MAG: 16S rRNA (guanine(966)-N(2))-methyltransferase RsmD [Oscillospiraceae bacterium]|nr:16S rRNA (guanine(966)-N(2))-methyltransferase RsmD [Oscillospiraceae bacterium]